MFKKLNMLLNQGSQTQIVGGPHSRNKMLRGPQKKVFAGRNTLENPLKEVKFDKNFTFLAFFEVFAGLTNAFGGPRV